MLQVHCIYVRSLSLGEANKWWEQNCYKKLQHGWFGTQTQNVTRSRVPHTHTHTLYTAVPQRCINDQLGLFGDLFYYFFLSVNNRVESLLAHCLITAAFASGRKELNRVCSTEKEKERESTIYFINFIPHFPFSPGDWTGDLSVPLPTSLPFRRLGCELVLVCVGYNSAETLAEWISPSLSSLLPASARTGRKRKHTATNLFFEIDNKRTLLRIILCCNKSVVN